MNNNFLSPGSVAVIGASNDKQKVGGAILARLIKSGYLGKVFPVNIHDDLVQNIQAYKNVLDIPSSVDLALIALPAALVLEAAKDCVQKGVKSLVVVSAGFAEAGNASLQDQLANLCRNSKVNLLGPNCLGFINTKIRLDLTFSASEVNRGNIAFISQSGAMGTSFLDWASFNKIGLSHFVSLGNKAGVNENELLLEFGSDPSVKYIMLYLEGFADGRRFVEICSQITKPIVVLTPGKHTAVAKAKASHTAALSSDNRIVNAALTQAGVLQVDTVEELFELMRFLQYQSLPQGPNVAIITNAGGVGIQTVDEFSETKLELAKLSEVTKQKLQQALPPAASVQNPVDILGDADAARYYSAAQILAQAPEVDALIYLLTPQMVTNPEGSAKAINDITDKFKKPSASCFMGGDSVEAAGLWLNAEKVPHFNFPGDAAKVLSNALKLSQLPKHAVAERIQRYNPALRSSRGNGMVEAQTTYELAKRFALPLLPGLVVRQSEVLSAVKEVGYPVVLKLAHPELAHKTEFKAIELNIKDETGLLEAQQRLESKATKLSGYQFEVQKFFEAEVEVFAGVQLDQSGFGHVMVVGSGGIYTEVYDDVAMVLLPADRAVILQALKQTKVFEIINGARGKNYPLEKLLDVFVAISDMIAGNNNITSLDVNPIMLTESDIYIADCKMYV